jgi:hypothetical protein
MDVGGALALHSLDEARRRGLVVMPICPFYQGWIQRHPEYHDLGVSSGRQPSHRLPSGPPTRKASQWRSRTTRRQPRWTPNS